MSGSDMVLSPPTFNISEPSKFACEIAIVTPLFGGGVSPMVPDPNMPVRAPAIRGHLRFWWRAAFGAHCATSEELFETEESIWGSVQHPSKVRVRVETVSQGKDVTWKKLTGQPRRERPPVYVAISPPKDLMVKTGVSFKLYLTFPDDLEQDVLTALTLWIKYGGIGARTRRGCGSLAVVAHGDNERLPNSGATVNSEPLHDRPPKFPQISGARIATGRPTPDPIQAWRTAVEVYQMFRQQRRGRAPLGRGKWPEAPAIERFGDGKTLGQDPNDGFPRADLGLPIAFERILNEDRAPILQGGTEGRQRFASPVITKALQVNPKEFRPAVMMLRAPSVWSHGDLELTHPKLGTQSIPRKLIDLPKDRRRSTPIPNDSIRDGLLKFVAEQWKTEIETL